MSEAIRRMPLAQAEALAAQLVELLAPACQRIEVAGSIRRKKPTIGDVELCAIARFAEDLLGGQGESLLDVRLDTLIQAGRLQRIQGGDKAKRFAIFSDEGEQLCNLDLYIATAETWPCIFLIRTGPYEFGKRLVTDKQHNGLCPSHMKFKNGRLMLSGDKPLDLKEEADVFRAIGLPFIPPEERWKLAPQPTK